MAQRLMNPYGMSQKVLDEIMRSKTKRILIRHVFRRNGPTLDGLLRSLDEDLAKRNMKWLLEKGVFEKKEGRYYINPDYLFTFKIHYNMNLLRMRYNQHSRAALEEISARFARVTSKDMPYNRRS